MHRTETAAPAAGSPAERSGLRPKDILLSLDDAQANSLNEVRNQIFAKNPGDFILFKVKRDDKELEFAILLEPQEDHIRSSDTPNDPKQQ